MVGYVRLILMNLFDKFCVEYKKVLGKDDLLIICKCFVGI